MPAERMSNGSSSDNCETALASVLASLPSPSSQPRPGGDAPRGREEGFCSQRACVCMAVRSRSRAEPTACSSAAAAVRPVPALLTLLPPLLRRCLADLFLPLPGGPYA